MPDVSATRIVIIQGHPDAGGGHYGHALADAYAEAAMGSGHAVRRIEVAAIPLPFLASKAEFDQAAPAPQVADAQQHLLWAEHIVIIYPLWLGMLPAVLKNFLEHVLRPEFAFGGDRDRLPIKLLKGRSVRVIVTMGMPAFFYRWFYGAPGLKALRRHVLKFCGFGPVRETLIGTIESPAPAARQRWLQRMRLLGTRAG